MSDDFAICRHCGAENSLVDITLKYPKLGIKPKKEVEKHLFCLNCGDTQLKSETKHRHIEYGGDPDGER